MNEKITWDVFDNPNEPRTLFRAILSDRKTRVDQKTFIADRPSFCVVSVAGNRVVRLEYYEGHDALDLVYDIRSKELTGEDLPKFLDSDPQGYDPVKFLKILFPELSYIFSEPGRNSLNQCNFV